MMPSCASFGFMLGQCYAVVAQQHDYQAQQTLYQAAEEGHVRRTAGLLPTLLRTAAGLHEQPGPCSVWCCHGAVHLTANS